MAFSVCSSAFLGVYLWVRTAGDWWIWDGNGMPMVVGYGLTMVEDGLTMVEDGFIVVDDGIRRTFADRCSITRFWLVTSQWLEWFLSIEITPWLSLATAHDDRIACASLLVWFSRPMPEIYPSICLQMSCLQKALVVGQIICLMLGQWWVWISSNL